MELSISTSNNNIWINSKYRVENIHKVHSNSITGNAHPPVISVYTQYTHHPSQYGGNTPGGFHMDRPDRVPEESTGSSTPEELSLPLLIIFP